jgi:hypothetical protein
MKILFIASTHNPFNPTQGASQRSSLLLQACTAIAYVDVISFCTENEPSTDKYNIIYQSVVPITEKDNFATYPTLQTCVGVEYEVKAINDIANGKLKTISNDLPSSLYTHPTIFEYIYHSIYRYSLLVSTCIMQFLQSNFSLKRRPSADTR